MTYKGLFLTNKESKDAACLGYAYAFENKDKWETLNVSSGDIDTYDFGTTFIVKENVVYTIHKDYLITDEDTRLYILKRMDRATDVIDDGSEAGD